MKEPKLIEIEIITGSEWYSRHVGRTFKAYSQPVYDYTVHPRRPMYQTYDKQYGHYHKCLVRHEHALKKQED